MLPFRWYRNALPLWVRSALFAIVVPGSVSVLFPYLILSAAREWDRFDLGGFRYVGVPFLLAGGIAYFRCLWEFTARGRGTPSPLDPPRTLVVTGLYRFVRNPMYVTVGFVLIGEILLFESAALLAFFLLFWLAVHLFTLWYEEPTLTRLFGESYESYCRRVPRWIPRL